MANFKPDDIVKNSEGKLFLVVCEGDQFNPSDKEATFTLRETNDQGVRLSAPFSIIDPSRYTFVRSLPPLR